uniref:hypothetical protein n=1 Tax=Alloprevotella sp. TaxID=1872471 RepID=UPI0040268F70
PFLSRGHVIENSHLNFINVIGKLQLQFVTEQNHFLREVLITLKIFAELLKPLSKVLLYPL